MLAKTAPTARHRPGTDPARPFVLVVAVLAATFVLGAQASLAQPDKAKDTGPPAHANVGGKKADAAAATGSTSEHSKAQARGKGHANASAEGASAPATDTSTTSAATTFAKPADPGGGGGGGGGSTGTVKIKTLGGTETRSNEPHRGCIFFIEFWNFAGPGPVTAALDLVTPTEGGITGGSGVLDGDGADGSHDATIELNLLDVPDIASVTPHRTGGEPGYHVSVSTTTPTGDQKSKTIWARNCPVALTPTPGIDVTKTCPAQAAVDDRINYQITVANTAQEILNNVTVTDTLLGTLTFPASLAVGQSETRTVSRTVLAGDPDPLVNTVTATGVGATSSATVTDTATCSTDIVPEVLGGQVPRPGAPGEPQEVQAEAPAEAALAFTGYWAVPLALVAAGLLLTGSSLLIVGRRRERRSKPL